MLRKGGTTLEAAGNIHTDLAWDFIQAQTMNCDDLIRLGSEREIKAAGLVRQEPKDYVIRVACKERNTGAPALPKVHWRVEVPPRSKAVTIAGENVGRRFLLGRTVVCEPYIPEHKFGGF